METKYKLVFYSPEEPLNRIKEALFEAGAGSYPGGKYTDSCFQTQGIGQFRPSASANPHTGKAGEVEKVPDIKVEIICVGKQVVHKSIEALKR